MDAGSGARKLYQIAFVLTIVFFAPISYATRMRKALGSLDTKTEEVFASMESYARMNVIRLFVVNIPAWSCIFTAIVLQQELEAT